MASVMSHEVWNACKTYDGMRWVLLDVERPREASDVQEHGPFCQMQTNADPPPVPESHNESALSFSSSATTYP